VNLVANYGGKNYLFRYDGQRFTRFSAEDGAPSSWITAISQDSQSRLWVGTVLGGVYVYDGKRFITPAALRQISTVYDLFHDRGGNTWLATNGGVVKFGAGWQPESGGALMRILMTADGVPHNEVRCLLEDKDGHLWFGTREGLTRYTPSTTPSVYIEQVVFADQTVQRPKEVEVSAAAKRVVIHYNAPSFRTPPHQMQYLVKLEGRDSDWSLTKERSVALLNLKPGEYTFRVKAIDRDLNYSEPASVSIVIPPPPFYQTGIFLMALSITGGVLLCGVIILVIQRWRSTNAEKRRLQQELEDAHRMQIRLLPESAPTVEGFEIAGFCRPAREVGGDFFDYLSLASGKIGIALADVSGKGLKGAMNAVLANGMLHATVKTEASCGKILSALNASLHPRMEKQMFTALGLAILNQDAKTLQWANAAQPYPIIKHGEQVFEFERDGGLPLSIMPNVSYPDWELELQAGDVVIFYTDGIIEAQNESEEMYGTERLKQVVAHIDSTMNAEEMIKTILQDVADFVGTAEQYDDMTVVVVKKL